MIGDGVIAESVISFAVTWTNPGKGQQPKWDQFAQKILLHTTSVYPDLKYTRAQAIATYYKYTTLTSLIDLIKEINSVIESNGDSLTEDLNQKQLPPSPERKQITAGSPEPEPQSSAQEPSEPKAEVPIEPQKKDEPGESDKSGGYTVIVHGDKLRMMDGQVSSANVRIRHRVSDNLTRMIDSEKIDNSKNIWVEIRHGLKSRRMELDKFTRQDGVNLLVQILPTVDLLLQPAEKMMVPKSERDEDYLDKIKHLRNIRMNREEARYARSREEIDTRARRVRGNQLR